MKNLISILILVFILAIFSCTSRNSRQEAESNFNKNKNIQVAEKCINNELGKSIKSYLNDLDENDYFRKNIFSIYFFRKNGEKYFTIWMSQDVPYSFIHNNPNITFNFSLLKIQDATVILITKDDFDIQELCNCEFLSFDLLVEKIPRADTLVIWDGSHFPATFRYWNNGELIIRKSDTLLIDFLGEDFEKFEKIIRNLN